MDHDYPKILLFGSSGQLGSHILSSLQRLNLVIAPTRFECDVTQPAQVHECVQRTNPDVVVNATGYTRVDRAETERDTAYAVNAYCLEAICDSANHAKALVIHYSTDYVFDGALNRPYTELDETNPINVYGRSKRAGEEIVEQVAEKYLVLRTAWLHSGTHDCFPRTILNRARSGQSLKLPNFYSGNPTSAELVSHVTERILAAYMARSTWESRAFTFGVYHVTTEGQTTWFDYAREIVRQARISGADLRDVQIESFCTPTEGSARRPLNGVLSSQKLINNFGIELPTWQRDISATVCAISRSHQ